MRLYRQPEYGQNQWVPILTAIVCHAQTSSITAVAVHNLTSLFLLNIERRYGEDIRILPCRSVLNNYSAKRK